MGKFHSTFYSFGDGSDLKVESFRQYFMEYDLEVWGEEGGGSLQYFSDDNIVVSLVVMQNPKYGILLSYDCYDKTNKKTLSNYYSVGNVEKLSIIEDIGDEEFFPIGSFLSPK